MAVPRRVGFVDGPYGGWFGGSYDGRTRFHGVLLDELVIYSPNNPTTNFIIADAHAVEDSFLCSSPHLAAATPSVFSGNPKGAREFRMAPPAAVAPILPNAVENWAEKSLEPAHIREACNRPNLPHDCFSDEVPLISLAGAWDGPGRASVRDRITRACEEWGLFQLVDHGVPLDVISSMIQHSRDFFALPMDDKLAHHIHKLNGSTDGGFLVSSPFKGDRVRDWREFYMFLTHPETSRDYSMWPEAPQGWRQAVEEYSDAVEGVAALILELLSEAMGLEKGAIREACGGERVQQKSIINFYPSCPQPELTFGVRRHTDPGTVTLLLQDQVGGLQTSKDNGKTWVAVRPVDGALVINLGDHSRFVSNSRFKSADHRAVVNSTSSRLSVATFISPPPDVMVYPLAIREGENPIMDEPISYNQLYRVLMDVERHNK